ncbi:MAG: PmoA family protein [Janthinobacterium lividum]
MLVLKWALVLLVAGSAHAQRLATLAVRLPQPTGGLAVPVSTSLDALTLQPDLVLHLVEVRGQRRTAVPLQIEHGSARVLHWLAAGSPVPTTRDYELRLGPAAPPTPAAMQVADEQGGLLVRAGARPLLRYNYRTVYPPAGVDTAYKRSGFIHPLWSPHGQELTRIQAPDHYHHYGLWNPWTHVLFEGDTVDFWNLADRKGTVRSAGVLATSGGPVYGEYSVLQAHVAFKKNGPEKTALREVQTVRVYQPTGPDAYLADLSIQLNCAAASPVTLLTYRYGGLGWRATAQWTKANSEVLTSAGKTRPTADGSTARWCLVQGQLGPADYGGVVLLAAPTNYNYPEPLRIWPEDQNGRGDVFASFSPTKTKAWPLVPGRLYALHYRLLVFNGHCTKEQAESAWQYFAHPPQVKVK